MYASNQILDITCTASDLPVVLDFAVRFYHPDMFTRDNGRIRMAFTVVSYEGMPDVYLIGTGSMEPYKTGPNKGWASKLGRGWTDFPFDYEPWLVAGAVAQWAKKQDIRMPDIDGCVEKGIRVISMHTAGSAGILPPFYKIHDRDLHKAVLAFTAYPMEYHK